MKAAMQAEALMQAQQLAAAHARHAQWQAYDAAQLEARAAEEAARSEPFGADRRAFEEAVLAEAARRGFLAEEAYHRR